MNAFAHMCCARGGAGGRTCTGRGVVGLGRIASQTMARKALFSRSCIREKSATPQMHQREYEVIKNDERGEELLRYPGKLVEMRQGGKEAVVEAIFRPPDVQLTSDVWIYRNDILTEHFYADRWYNVFRIMRPSDRQLRGWYCNICRPADIHDSFVSADDLALDLVISPSGLITILDSDEFLQLNISATDRRLAEAASEEVRTLVKTRSDPFGDIRPNQGDE